MTTSTSYFPVVHSAIYDFFHACRSVLGSMTLDDIYSRCMELHDVRLYLHNTEGTESLTRKYLVKSTISAHIKMWIDGKDIEGMKR